MAGNRAVTSLLAQREVAPTAQDTTTAQPSLAEFGLTPADAVDSELPSAATGTTAAAPAAESAEVQRRAGPHSVQRSGTKDAVLQRVLGSCAAYNGYSTTVPLASYNCAGLAHRTYDYKGLAATRALLSRAGAGSGATAGQIKHWLWEYDVWLEDSTGNRITTPSADFHTVAGEVPAGGGAPAEVYSKNGARPVFGPGTGPSFKPAAREQARRNDPSDALATDSAGRPIYKLRQNITESVFAVNCPSQTAPTQGPPAP